MTDLLAARSQMAMSLGFHIVFAEIGVAMPLMMVLAEWRWLRTGEREYLELARRWAKGVAILFAVGAVSGTVLSFELGLLWPGFMKFAGPIVGVPFSLEGFAFFTEAIFLGVYLYGWDRLSRRAHLLAGIVVAVSGAASAVFVLMVNAWMNTPTGVTMAGGTIVAVDPVAGMLSPAAFPQALHMVLAAYASTGLAVAGVHAWMLRRGAARGFHRRALIVALWVGAPAALLQPLSGDISARLVAETQPVKLAALEGQFATERGAPLRIGGWPDAQGATTRFALEIPRGLSLLAYHEWDAEVKGLTAFPRSDWPPLAPVHVSFQIMVALGTAMALVALWAAWVGWRKREIAEQPWLLRALVVVAPFGFIATEVGWMVTEIGRQPWVVQGLLRTSDAVTPMPGLIVPLTVFTLLYLVLGTVVVALIAAMVRDTAGEPAGGDAREPLEAGA
ncbi:MAG: cytochrome ubiquinol oxidase subunit I [Gemmatimonadaceae bacterium]|nr:cytochrome ubiquinol oxidase subunit I [Gemmatimonadaceae bacterium]